MDAMTQAKRKRQKAPIDWERVEKIMLRGIQGHFLSPEDMVLVNAAYARAPMEYGKRHYQVKAAEIARKKRELI